MLINDDTIEVNNLSNNEDHMTFKNPFMSHEKGESSKANQNGPPKLRLIMRITTIIPLA